VPKRRFVPVAAIAATVVLALWVLAALAGIAVLDPLADALGLARPALHAALIVVPLAAATFGGRNGRNACWGLAAAELAVAVLPWPGALGHAGHGHQVLLLLAALAATAAADAAGRGGLLRPAPGRP
jgi:L-cystine uptake protein TcyP (sodium:dicarboxylate symporter family)